VMMLGQCLFLNRKILFFFPNQWYLLTGSEDIDEVLNVPKMEPKIKGVKRTKKTSQRKRYIGTRNTCIRSGSTGSQLEAVLACDDGSGWERYELFRELPDEHMYTPLSTSWMLIIFSLFRLFYYPILSFKSRGS
jgi:hypothetical protein